jgi:hypothetical protein
VGQNCLQTTVCNGQFSVNVNSMALQKDGCLPDDGFLCTKCTEEEVGFLHHCLGDRFMDETVVC